MASKTAKPNEQQKPVEPKQETTARAPEDHDHEGSQLSVSTKAKERRNREYFKAELNRVDQQIKKEAERIQKPPEREFFPEVFNGLEPYQDLSTPRFVITMPDDVLHNGAGYKTRATAQGMTEPWVDLKMDVEKDFVEQQQQAAAPSPRHQKRDASPGKKQPPKIRRDRTEILQGTILPRYPIVHVDNPDLASRELTFSDVKDIREEVRNKYMACSAAKTDADYKYTKEDFVKLELDKIAEVRPSHQSILRQAYFAYLQNTPGSKKAIRDCMREHDKVYGNPSSENQAEKQQASAAKQKPSGKQNKNSKSAEKKAEAQSPSHDQKTNDEPKEEVPAN